MSFLDFQGNSIALNIGVFAVAAVVIWLAGTRIAFYADVIADRTGIGKAFMGLVFLALATETPEIGTTVSAAITGNAQLAMNNIFGGVNMQTAILAVVDLALVRGALTFFTPKPVLLLQGVLLILLLGLALTAIAAGETLSFMGVGLWSAVLFIAYAVSLFISRNSERRQNWNLENAPSDEQVQESVLRPEDNPPQERFSEWSTRRLVLFFAIGTLFILAAGFLLARVGEALAEQTGLGSSFIGATLIAASTSLPELSTTMALVRLGNYSMAFANIFGSNSIMMLLVFIADIAYRQGPILEQTNQSAMFAAASGVVITAVYMVGMLERRDRTILRMGIDSAVVLVIYGVSLVVLYTLR